MDTMSTETGERNVNAAAQVAPSASTTSFLAAAVQSLHMFLHTCLLAALTLQTSQKGGF